MGDRVLDLPKDGDKQRCLRCDEDALDTGWECTSCGYDNQPWYYPKRAEKSQEPRHD